MDTEHGMSMAEFSSMDAARAWRAQHGGWLFECEGETFVLWFALPATPTLIFTHPSTRGRNGRLL